MPRITPQSRRPAVLASPSGFVVTELGPSYIPASRADRLTIREHQRVADFTCFGHIRAVGVPNRELPRYALDGLPAIQRPNDFTRPDLLSRVTRSGLRSFWPSAR
jgi:hypothetical protein